MKCYSFLLHTLSESGQSRTATNPFTGEAMRVDVPSNFTGQEQAALEAFLFKHHYEGPEPEGEGYVRKMPEDVSIRIRGMDMESGVACGNLSVEVTTPELHEYLLKHLYELAVSTKLAVMSVTGDNVLWVGDSISPAIKQRWPDAVCIKSEEAFCASIDRVWNDHDGTD